MVETCRLKDHILAQLVHLPNPQRLRVTVLQSTPKRAYDLYPHTPHQPRCFHTELFVVLGCELERAGSATEAVTATAMATGAGAATGIATTSSAALGTAEGAKDGVSSPASMVLTSAISAQLYTLPQTSPPSSILYISKLDSSSYGPRSRSAAAATAATLPLTRSLAVAFISFFVLPSTSVPPQPSPSLSSAHASSPVTAPHRAAAGATTPVVKVQLFARSQGQYLFPNSQAGKKGLSGGRLCGWWKGVYEDVARRAVAADTADNATLSGSSIPSAQSQSQSQSQPQSHSQSDARSQPRSQDIYLAYYLPSYSAMEAAGLMGLPRQPLPQGVSWRYEPPFSPTAPGSGSVSRALALTPGEATPNLADLIPSLDDDPKLRFLEEVASDVNRELSERKREQEQSSSSIQPNANGSQGEPASEEQASNLDVARGVLVGGEPEAAPSTSASVPSRPLNASQTPAPTCPSQAQKKKPTPSAGRSAKAIAAQQEDEAHRRRAHAALGKIRYGEFWERMGFRGECAADVTGFFSLIVSPASAAPTATHANGAAGGDANGTADKTVQSEATGAETGAVLAARTTAPAAHPPHADPVSQKGQLPPAIVERLHTALLNTDFGTLELAMTGSRDWQRSAETIVTDETGAEGWRACCGFVEAKDAAQLEVMVGAGNGGQGGEKRKEEAVVTMLQPRKKKRPA